MPSWTRIKYPKINKIWIWLLPPGHEKQGHTRCAGPRSGKSFAKFANDLRNARKEAPI